MPLAALSSLEIAVDIAIETPAWAAVAGLDGLVRRAIDAALAQAGVAIEAGAELSLVLCDDAFIRDLNRTWRGKDASTNVLSFPTEEPMLLGDVIVAYETSAREAEAEGRTLAHHLSHLVVHGVLHLLGYDHEDEAEADEMEALESRVLATLGIADPYAGAGDRRLDAEDRRARP